MKKVLLLLILISPPIFARTYSTTFPLIENPISENGNWINGQAQGIDWNNVQVNPNVMAHGVPSEHLPQYADPTAIVTGTWANNQSAQGIVYSNNPTTNYYQEVELRLRTQISPNSITGYEINFRCLKTADGYTQIVRWNGARGNFTFLAGVNGSQYGVKTGDIVKATIVGNIITAYINGVQVLQATDNAFPSGNPGIGFNFGMQSSASDFGYTSFIAQDIQDEAHTLHFSWDANTESDLAGYRLYSGISSKNYTNNYVLGLTLLFDLTGLGDGTYFFGLTSYDIAGNESGFSNEVSATLPKQIIPPPPATYQFNFTIPGGVVVAGYTNDSGGAFNSTLGYGWVTSPTGSRQRGINPNPLLDSFVYTSGALATWNLVVPNGNYTITLACGDPTNTQGPQRVDVEGVRVINDVTTTGNNFATATNVPITVSDGQLTVVIGGTAGNTLLNYLTVASVGGGGSGIPAGVTGLTIH